MDRTLHGDKTDNLHKWYTPKMTPLVRNNLIRSSINFHNY